MLNEEKIKLMTGIAMFEKKHEKRYIWAKRHFKGDYISRYLFRSFFSFTICALLLIGVWVLYHLGELLQITNLNDLINYGVQGVLGYIIGLAFYLSITYLIYSKRYGMSKSSLRVYIAKLKRLEKRYEFQNRTKELAGDKGGKS